MLEVLKRRWALLMETVPGGKRELAEQRAQLERELEQQRVARATAEHELIELRAQAEREPRADVRYEGKVLSVKSYNQGFVNKLRFELGDLTLNKTDDEVVQIYVDRENLAHEEPKLTVEHAGIDADGRIKMRLDWNQAFIKLLREQAGIVAENDEDAVQAYLARLTVDVAEDLGLPTQLSLSQDDVRSAFAELDADYDREMAEAEKLAKKLRHAQRSRKKPDGR